MAASTSPRRPKLSLQCKSLPGPNTRSSRTSYSKGDPTSPTSFNTVSNAYMAAIQKSTPPVQASPLTAVNHQSHLQQQHTTRESLSSPQQRIRTPNASSYPDTPLSANPASPAKQMELLYPSIMTATPPLSSGPVENADSTAFKFPLNEASRQATTVTPAQTCRPPHPGSLNQATQAPYTRIRGLHSILRNSPLPPSLSPISPRRQSRRLQEKAARRVGYESPLTQTITTEKYIRSHVDLLSEESPFSASPAAEDSDKMLGLVAAYTEDETRDGGHTPGPREEMGRRMADLPSSPRPGGVRKRKSREKKRRWVWTIGQDDEQDDANPAKHATSVPQSSAPLVKVPRRKPDTPKDSSSNARSSTEYSAPGEQVSIITRMAMDTPQTSESSGPAAGEVACVAPAAAVQTGFGPAETVYDAANDRMDVDTSGDSSILSSSRATTPCSVEDAVSSRPAGPDAAATPRAGRQGLDLVAQIKERKDSPMPPDLVTNWNGLSIVAG